MVTIQIDPSSIVDRFNLSQDDINDLLDYTIKEVTARFAHELQNEAFRTLKSGRAEYIQNINVVDEGFAAGSVVITGYLPNAIEQGLAPYDMKPGFLNGPNAKDGINGKYNTIPFSFGTPGAKEENFTGGIMPQEVYDVAKDKKIISGTNHSVGITKGELPLKFQEPQVKTIQLPKSKSFIEYQHKSSIYEGIRKEKDHVTGQNRYQSFRRVSEKSDPNSWWHPGFEKADLVGKTLAEFNVPNEIGKILDKLL